MPTYVYTCDSCGKDFEKFQSFKEAPLQTCPHCSNDTVRRVFQPVGIVFKGSGWYITDSRNASNASLTDNSSSNTNTSSTNSSSSESSKDTASTESTSSTSNTSSTSSTSESKTSAPRSDS